MFPRLSSFPSYRNRTHTFLFVLQSHPNLKSSITFHSSLKMAAATMNVAMAAVACTSIATAKTPASSFGGQRLVVGRGVSVVTKRHIFVVRAEDKGAGKNLQDAGEQFSAAVQRGAESVRDNLQGTQADATSKAKSAASTAESKAMQTTNDADSIGSKIPNSIEDAKDSLFGAGKDAQKDAEKNLNKAQNAADSTGKDAQNKAGNVLDNLQQGLSDATDNAMDAFKGNN